MLKNSGASVQLGLVEVRLIREYVRSIAKDLVVEDAGKPRPT
jgi:hypothetical protein